MDYIDFYRGFVQENFFDFESDQGNVRKGINAAVSAFHMADHYFYFNKRNNPSMIKNFLGKKGREKFLIFLGKKSKFFNDIQSITNVYKHLYSNPQKAHVMVDSAGRIEVIAAKGNITDVDRSNHKNNDFVAYTTVKPIKQTKKLMDALKDVIDMWDDILFGSGL